MRINPLPGFVAVTLAVTCPLAANGDDESKNKRPTRWAQPLTIDGVPNLFRVSKHLYRSAQPTAEGMRNLRQLGVTTVINLRSFHSDRDEIGDTGLGYEHIYMKAWHPEEKELVRFLQITTDKRRAPVLVHCQHGSDRTGLMCAVYRIAVQGWSKDDALKEMEHGGYGFHPIWANLVHYIRKLDIDRIKSKAGLQKAKSSSPRPSPNKPTLLPAIITQHFPRS